MLQVADERLSGLDGGGVAPGDRQVIAGVLPQLVNNTIRDPDRGIEEMQDGREPLEREDDQITTPDVREFVKERPAELLRRETGGESSRQQDRRPQNSPD